MAGKPINVETFWLRNYTPGEWRGNNNVETFWLRNYTPGEWRGNNCQLSMINNFNIANYK